MVSEVKTLVTSHEKSDRYFVEYFNYYRMRWSFHSYELLEDAETKIFAKIKAPFKRYHVNIGQCVGENDAVWTCSMNEESTNTPVVMIHGYGAGSAFWAMNLEEISEEHPVYVFDTLGFARSSRPEFSDDPDEIELQFVESIEKWREAMGFEKMVLLGHSFGGYQASAYALKYPDRLEHLVLVDPWGFDKAPDVQNFPLWKLSIANILSYVVGPFVMVRAFGPFGEWLIKNFRPDLLQKYNSIVDPSIFSQYIYHCNSNLNYSGEAAFHKMAFVGPCEWSPLGHVWPRKPMGLRFQKGVSDEVPVTFLYGEQSWTSNNFGQTIKDYRENSFTDFKIVEKAGHHIYTDNAPEFNKAVLEACKVSRTQKQ